MYDPTIHGTPLALLQLPPAAVAEVTQRLAEPEISCVRFTQDGKSVTDLRDLVGERHAAHALESEAEVGFACKKCQTVFPAEALCQNHQRALCFAGKPVADGKAATLRLVQAQYECGLCREKWATQLEFKFHCDSEIHAKRLRKFSRDGGKNKSTQGTPSPAATPQPPTQGLNSSPQLPPTTSPTSGKASFPGSRTPAPPLATTPSAQTADKLDMRQTDTNANISSAEVDVAVPLNLDVPMGPAMDPVAQGTLTVGQNPYSLG